LAPKIRVRNPIGSGDAVTAGIAHSLLRRQTLDQGLRLGTALGTANCLNLYPGRIEPSAYRQILEQVEVREL
jgi:tagatose 6-phosphate kinase